MLPLVLEDLHPNPIVEFRAWFATADSSTVAYVNAMVLSTIGEDGFPNSRVVLLKECDEEGFTFFTNTHSRKGRELAAHPRAALNFYWDHQRRQIRIQGTVESVSTADADAYFRTRSRLSQIGACASLQSEELPDRRIFEQKIAQLEHELAGKDVPRPAHWSGYRLIPHRIEFWQEREARLHDRFEYRRATSDAPWTIHRLYP